MKKISLSKKQLLFIILSGIIIFSVTSGIIGSTISVNHNKNLDLGIIFLTTNYMDPSSANFTVSITSNTNWTAIIEINSYVVKYGFGNWSFGEQYTDCSFTVTQTETPGYVTAKVFKDGKKVYDKTLVDVFFYPKLGGKFSTRILDEQAMLFLYQSDFYKNLYIGPFDVFPYGMFIYLSILPAIIIFIAILEEYGKVEAYSKVKSRFTKKKKKEKLVVFVQKCPECRAPLNKKIPCKCDYCGTVINKVNEKDKLREFSYIIEDEDEEEEEQNYSRPKRPKIIPRGVFSQPTPENVPEKGKCLECGIPLLSKEDQLYGVCEHCRTYSGKKYSQKYPEKGRCLNCGAKLWSDDREVGSGLCSSCRSFHRTCLKCGAKLYSDDKTGLCSTCRTFHSHKCMYCNSTLWTQFEQDTGICNSCRRHI